jgi:glucokinase-like ROK family protein
MAAANKKLIRAINRFKILHTIRAHKLISRVDITKATGLSQATVTGITASLIGEGLLLEKRPGESEGGRPPILISLNPDATYAVGVYLSISQINIVIIDLEATIRASYEMPLRKQNYTPEAIADKIVQAVQECMWQANFSRNRISGIGIGLPGLVDSHTGLIRFLPNYQWEKVNLRDLVQKKIDHPTYIENSANSLTLAEQWFGEGRGIDNFIVVTLEYGVGMGIMIHGQLYRGHKGTAGEFGHTTVDPDGPLCRCGKKGCIEAIVGNNAILREAEAAAQKGEWKPDNPHDITIDEVILAAREGAPCLRNIFARAGRILAIGLSNLILIFNPAKIIISGRGVKAGELLFDSMYNTIPQYTSSRTNGDAEIVIKSWNQNAYALGSGTVVLQEIFKSPANRVVPII